MFWIVTLIIVGILLFFAELVLLPGITVAAVGAFLSLVAAVSLAFMNHGAVVGTITLVVVLAILAVMMVFFLRPKTWRKMALNTSLKETIGSEPTVSYRLGQRGVTLTRLAPMGKVRMESGEILEARSLDSYVDPKVEVEIIGFENSYIIVKLAEI